MANQNTRRVLGRHRRSMITGSETRTGANNMDHHSHPVIGPVANLGSRINTGKLRKASGKAKWLGGGLAS